MLFLVIERFRDRDPLPVRARFLEKGRLMPAGLEYRGSWIDADEARCFQLMEAERVDLLDAWIERWSDLVDFEVVSVLESADYWARFTDPSGVDSSSSA